MQAPVLVHAVHRSCFRIAIAERAPLLQRSSTCEVDKVRAAASWVVSVMLSEGECLNNALNNEWYAE